MKDNYVNFFCPGVPRWGFVGCHERFFVSRKVLISISPNDDGESTGFREKKFRNQNATANIFNLINKFPPSDVFERSPKSLISTSVTSPKF